MKYLATTLLYLLFSIGAFAQTGSVSGRAVSTDGTPQEFANVLLMSVVDSSLIKGAVSDLDGSYVIESIPTGEYYIVLSLVGFDDTRSASFAVDNNHVELGDMILSAGVTLSEVTVTTERPFIEMKADKVVVNVANSSVNSGNSALEVLEKSPGIIVDKDKNISLRGKQGVLVLINGKNQYMTGEQLSNLLESMPADNIKSIEIIANPSAKYDAEGNSGVINIQLAKNENEGYNGSVNAGFRQGIKTSYNSGLDLNYRSGRINLFGAVNHSDWGGYQDIDLYRTISYQNGSTVFDQNAIGNYGGNGINGRLGLDYTLSDKTTIGILYKLNDGESKWLLDNNTTISGDNAPPFNQLHVNSVQDNGWRQHSANVNLTHEINQSGTTLSIDADYSRYDADNFNTYDNEYKLNGAMIAPNFELRNNAMTDIDILAAKADLSLPMGQGYNVDLGVKVSMVSTDNDTRFEALDKGSWVNQPNRTNNFIYEETIYAGYANASRTFGKVSVQGGLRVEHTLSDGNSVTLDNRVKREYTNLFPSISISHPMGEAHSLSYTYSRRLTRPNYQSLNPFIEYLDDYTFQKGNPLLTPQYSNSFGLNYGYGNKIFVSVDYSRTTDAITEVIEQIAEENATYQTDQNLDNFDNISINVTAPIVWNDWLTTRASLSSFYNGFKSVIPSGVLDNASWGHYLYIGNQVQLPQGIGMELNANYQSRLTYGLFDVRSRYGIDIGFTKTVMGGKGNLKIGLDDIFRTRRQGVTISQDDINFTVQQQRDTRRAKINFTYRFGNNKVKAARKRTTATEDEANRIAN